MTMNMFPELQGPPAPVVNHITNINIVPEWGTAKDAQRFVGIRRYDADRGVDSGAIRRRYGLPSGKCTVYYNLKDAAAYIEALPEVRS